MYGFIYITTNLINGKRYLGQCKYGKQCTPSYLGSGRALKRAVNKYGTHSFSRAIIEECLTKELLVEREIHYIRSYNCVADPMWYNIAEGGYTTRGFLGRKHSDETREKMKNSYRYVLSEEGKRRIGDAARSRTGAASGRSRKVTVEGITYITLQDAFKSTGIALKKLRILAADQSYQ